MKVINYECSLCEEIWGEENTLGVKVEKDKVTLVEPEESDKHVCRNCIRAIRDFGNEN